MKTICILILLAIPAMAQVKTVQPIRVGLTVEDSDASSEFNKQLHAELNKLRRVAFTSERADFDVFATCGPIVTSEKVVGYGVAVALVRADGRISVMLVMEQTVEAVARRTATRINEEFFDRR